jgi:tRNA threonylcarbamoyl adenosine modification protein YeaZ
MKQSPIVLAVDTVGKAAGVALLVSPTTAFTRDLGERGGHAEALLPAVHALLEESGLGWDAIDLLAVAEGPGSFTGVRIGVAFVLGVSDARGIPASGVGSLDILARGCYDAIMLETGSYVIASMDIRRGEVALARYRVTRDSGFFREMDPALAAVLDPGPPPPPGSAVAGDGASLLWPEAPGLLRWPGSGPERALALARLALDASRTDSLHVPVPRYAGPPQTRPRRP